jgi:hypothetical protein
VSHARAPIVRLAIIRADRAVLVWTLQPVLLVHRFPAEWNVRPDVSPIQVASTMNAFAMPAMLVLSLFCPASSKATTTIPLLFHPILLQLRYHHHPNNKLPTTSRSVESMPWQRTTMPHNASVFPGIKETIRRVQVVRMWTNVGRPMDALPIKSASTRWDLSLASPATAPQLPLAIHAARVGLAATHLLDLLVKKFLAMCNVLPDVVPIPLASTMNAFAMPALVVLGPFYRALNKAAMALFHRPNAVPSPRVEPIPRQRRKMRRNASVCWGIKEMIRRVRAVRISTNVCRPIDALSIRSV